MFSSSRTPTLTPSRSPSPTPPVQPDHFYGSEDIQLPPSPSSDGKTWLDPEDDPLAHRGIPVFKPTIEEFQDFEGYVSKIECWGSKSGIVKVIPPLEWTAALPPLKDQLVGVKIKTPIEQHMLGRGGLFRQENMEKRKLMSVREWAELCSKDEFRAPGVGEVGLQARNGNMRPRTVRKTKKKTEIVKAEAVGPDIANLAVKEEPVDDDRPMVFGDSGSNNKPIVLSPPNSDTTPPSPGSEPPGAAPAKTEGTSERKPKKRVGPSREAREAALAGRAAQDLKFLETFSPQEDWLPPNTKASDYTRDFCQTLERHYWRNCGLGRPAWYGADTQGSLYTDETTAWNVAHLSSTLSRLLPADNQGLPGVNTPYLYFGMWRATFAWHVEDMDLFSINFIHFGAPKFWYAIPQGRAVALEQTMRGYFPKDTTNCPQFLRHKSFLASPTLLAQSSCRPNFLVQHSGEFVITFPRGYHAGFNLGFNCAESVNFALDSWLELGRRAKACECISDSVRIDVDQLLADRAAEAANPKPPPKPKRPSSKKENGRKDKSKVVRKRKLEKIEDADEQPKAKKLKIKLSPPKSTSASGTASKVPSSKLSITLKLGPRPAALEPYPCCLCVSMDKEGLLRVHDPPVGRKDAEDAAGNPQEWMAHEFCANVVPETWVDEIEVGPNSASEKVVYGVDGIVKDRWHLKCSACTKTRPRAHGAPIQCTKGKCPKAFHVSCAREGVESGILFNVVRDVEKEVLLLEPTTPASTALITPAQPDAMQVEIAAAHTHVNGTITDPSSSSRVLKVIKKLEVQVLCSQHNPVVAAAKKEAKQDKIKAELLALPPMARIKIRVSSGVFEVSLIRVIEAARSVEVLWDKGDKKEFKWNSIVFGNTEGPVQQKPSELVPKPEPIAVGIPVPTYKSVTAVAVTRKPQATDSQPVASSSKPTTTHQYGAPTGYAYPPRTGPYDYWQYQNPQYSALASSHPYGYPGYYPAAQHAGPSHYSAYAYTQNQYHSAQFWQQPYQGQTPIYYRPGQEQPQHTSLEHPSSQGQQNQTQPPTLDPTHNTHPPPQHAGIIPTQSAPAHVPASTNSLSSEAQQGLYKDLATLSSLEPAQLSDMLRDDPHLREVVMAAVGEAQKTLATL